MHVKINTKSGNRKMGRRKKVSVKKYRNFLHEETVDEALPPVLPIPLVIVTEI